MIEVVIISQFSSYLFFFADMCVGILEIFFLKLYVIKIDLLLILDFMICVIISKISSTQITEKITYFLLLYNFFHYIISFTYLPFSGAKGFANYNSSNCIVCFFFFSPHKDL